MRIQNAKCGVISTRIELASDSMFATMFAPMAPFEKQAAAVWSEHDMAAARIQATARGAIARDALARQRRQNEQSAAVVLQAAARAGLVRAALRRQRQRQSAVVIQAAVRRHWATTRAKAVVAQKRDCARQQAALEEKEAARKQGLFEAAADATRRELMKKYTAIVGVDFGTACSGIAYTMTGDPDHKIRAAAPGEDTEIKTPTSLLVRGSDVFFGNEAEDLFAEVGAP